MSSTRYSMPSIAFFTSVRVRAALGTVDKVITSDVLSRLYGTPIEVLHVHNRILVVSGKGMEEVDAHRHDV